VRVGVLAHRQAPGIADADADEKNLQSSEKMIGENLAFVQTSEEGFEGGSAFTFPSTPSSSP